MPAPSHAVPPPLIAGALLVSVLGGAGPARAIPVPTTVAIGEVGGSPESRSALMGSLRDQLETMKGVRVTAPARARYVLRGSVTRLGRDPQASDHPLRCDVSIVVAERQSGAIRAVLSGRARTADGDLEHIGPLLVEGAVKSALRSLPLALGAATTPR